MRIDAGVVRRWHHYVHSWLDLLLLGHRCAQVPRVGTLAGRDRGIPQILYLVLVTLERECRSVSAVHTHSNAALELFGVCDRGAAHVLSSDRQAHHEFSLASNVDLPRRVLTEDGSIIGAAASCIGIPHPSYLLREHALTLRSNRPNVQRLIAFNRQGASQISAFLEGAEHQSVERIRLQHESNVTRLRLVWLLLLGQMYDRLIIDR